jgi:DNA-binding SARP family transcriptional activator
MMIFRILGPIEAWNGEQQLAVGGPRQLRLLAYLLVHANRAVPSDVLTDALWGPSRGGAGNRLQMSIARLRKALAPVEGPVGPALRTVVGGYMLSVGPEQVDAEVFEGLVRKGRQMLDAGEAESAAATLRDALALWRGYREPLAQVAFEEFAQGEIRRLVGERLEALETRIDADLQCGRHAQLIGELEGLLREEPLRERLAGQLMIALYRSERQGDALDVYQRTWLQIRDQLGLEPGPALKALQAGILAQAPSLGDAVHPGAAVPSPIGPAQPADRIGAPLPSRLQPYGPSAFVDRRDERQALYDALRQAASTGRQIAFVTGEPGIGKTRLVSEVASDAHARGTLVLAGRCDEGLDLPYQPFVEALEHLVEHAPRKLLDAHVAQYGDSLARLVPTLVPGVLDRPATMPPASESERYMLYQSIEGLLAAAGAGGSVLLVLEDLQWADLPTLRLLRRLLGSPRRLPMMLLCTCRVSDLADGHPLRELLADLHREPHSLRLALGGLERDDVIALLRGITDAPHDTADDQLLSALEAGTNGNPFFITELVRGLVETGALIDNDGRWQLSPEYDPAAHLPPSITETLARRLRRMDERVRRCLQVAAVIGNEFDLDLVSELAGSPAADALDVAVENAVLIEVPRRVARFRFTHTLMQRYLYTELGAAHRAELHRRVALAIEAGSEYGRWPTAELARHWLAAGDGEAEKAREYSARAGDEALAKLAPDDALRWYGVAIELLDRQANPDERELTDLLIRRGEAERQAGNRAFRTTLLDAAELARRTGDKPALIRAALANSRGMQSETGIVDDSRIATLDAALQAVGEDDSPERARLLAMQAAELMYSPERERRFQLSDEALAIARRLDDPDALSAVLNMRFVTLLAHDTHTERSANAVEGVAAAERVREPLVRFFAYHWRGYACIESGDILAARAWVAREREIADRFRQPTTLWLARADEANLAIIAGNLEVADRLASDAFELGRNSEPDALACCVAQRTSIAFESGRLGELIPMLEQAAEQNPGVPGFRATLALALSEVLRLDEARTILDKAAAASFAEVPRDLTWLAVVCIYAHVGAKLGDLPAARTLYGMLEPWGDQIAYPAFGVWGPVALYLGSLAVTIGDTAGAERHLSEAARAAARADAPIWEERAASQLP